MILYSMYKIISVWKPDMQY